MHQISSWISEWFPRSQTSRWPSQCTRKSERRLSMNGERKVRPHPALSPGRGRSVLAHSLFMVPMRVKKTSRLSLNRTGKRASSPQPSPPEEEREKALPQWARDDPPPSPREERAGRGLGRGATPGLLPGSWSQCTRKSERRLSMDRAAKRASSARPSPPEEERGKSLRRLVRAICLPRPARHERGEGWGESSGSDRRKVRCRPRCIDASDFQLDLWSLDSGAIQKFVKVCPGSLGPTQMQPLGNLKMETANPR